MLCHRSSADAIQDYLTPIGRHSSVRLMLIRHAETGHNRDSRVQGQADVPLSDLGLRQAQALGHALRDQPIAAMVSSPLARARVTAEAVAAPHSLLVQSEP